MMWGITLNFLCGKRITALKGPAALAASGGKIVYE